MALAAVNSQANLLFGVFGEYLGRVYEQVKQRPDAIVVNDIKRQITESDVWQSIFRHGYEDTPRNRILMAPLTRDLPATTSGRPARTGPPTSTTTAPAGPTPSAAKQWR